MIGSHIGYSSRYLKTFGSFQNTVDEIFAKTPVRNRETTNNYDCSIEYTDFVLEELIKILEQQQRPAFLIYAGDHSECSGIDDFEIARASNCNIRACYEIPFLVWISPQYKKLYQELIDNGRKNLAAPLQGDHAIWTIADLAQLSWNNFPVESSLFSAAYRIPDKRYMHSQEY